MNRFTKLFAAAALALTVGSASRVCAQEFQESYKAIEVGPIAQGGISVFMGSVPDGAKTDLHLAYSFGVLADYMFNKNFGAALGLGYESRGMYFKKNDASTPNWDVTTNYLSIQPSLKMKAFLLGVNINIPMSSTGKYDLGGSIGSTSSTINKDSLGTLIDIRLGALLPLVESEKGNLDFTIMASYCLTNMFGDNNVVLYGMQTDYSKPITKSPVPTLQMGFTYLFSPGGLVYEKR